MSSIVFHIFTPYIKLTVCNFFSLRYVYFPTDPQDLLPFPRDKV